MSCMCRSPESEKKIATATSHPFAGGHKTIALSALDKDDLGFGAVGVPLPGPVVGTPAAAPPPIKKTVNVYPINVAASIRDPYADAATANTIWGQCGLKINMLIGECWN